LPGLPHHFVKTAPTTVQMVAAVIGGQPKIRALQCKPASGDSIGIAP